MNLLFILSGNISTTPRAQKLIEFFVKKGYSIDIIAINRAETWQKLDNDVLPAGVNYDSIDITRRKSIWWLIATAIHYFAKVLWKFFQKSIMLSAFSSSKATVFLWLRTLRVKKKYTRIFGHSYGSMFVAYSLAKRLAIPFVFDVEDYHPGEYSPDAKENLRRQLLMCRILPHADFITFASPLIAEYTLKLIGDLPQSMYALVDNSFCSEEFEFVNNQSQKIKFVWFSQNIGARRGLELALPALANFANKVELHLIGNVQQDFYNSFLNKYQHFIVFHSPMPQRQLHKFLCQFDIGLAIELSSADLNRQLALSNKIFAYAQAGLFILATDTPAQKLFIQQNDFLSILVQQNENDFFDKIFFIVENIEKIRNDKIKRFTYSKKFDYFQNISQIFSFEM